MQNHALKPYVLSGIIWVCLLALYIHGGIDITPMNADEPTYTHMGKDFYHIFIDPNYSEFKYNSPYLVGDAWQIVASDTEFRLLNGTTPNYIYGWVASALGYKIDDIHDIWDWSLDYEGNLSAGNIPDKTLFRGFRTIAAIQLTIAVGLLFSICHILINRPVAYLATLYFALQPNILADGRRALVEGTHLMFMMLAILSAIWLIQNRKNRHFILFGLVAGFAVAAKHPNVITVTLLFLACSSFFIIQWAQNHLDGSTALKYLVGLFVSGVISITTMFALNPTWWNNPLVAIHDVIEIRSTLVNDVQRPMFDAFGKELHDINDRLSSMFVNVFVAEFDSFSYAQFEHGIIYNASHWDGVPVGGSTIGGILVIVITVVGLITFWRNQSISSEYRWLISVWGIGTIMVSFLIIPFFWSRYYHPIVPFIAMMFAYGIYSLSKQLMVFKHTTSPTQSIIHKLK